MYDIESMMPLVVILTWSNVGRYLLNTYQECYDSTPSKPVLCIGSTSLILIIS
jgi:hypothetical protein